MKSEQVTPRTVVISTLLISIVATVQLVIADPSIESGPTGSAPESKPKVMNYNKCPHSYIGINLQTTQNPEFYSKVAAASMGWVRIAFNWNRIHFRNPETGEESFVWDRTDKAVRLAHENGLKVFATLAYAPDWAQKKECQSQKPCPPQDSLAWDRFVRAAVSRYSTLEISGAPVEKWGLWNEPNLSAFWLGSRDEFITNILKPGYSAVKETNPNAEVVAPDLAYGKKYKWQQWIKALGKEARDFFDIFSFHVYVEDHEDFDNDSKFDTDGDLVALVANKIKPDLKRAGILGANKRVWLTEFGWRTYKAEVDYKNQAAYLTGVIKAMVESKQHEGDLSWLGKIFIYAIADDNIESGSKNKWGILEGKHKNFAPKPAYFAIQSLLSKLDKDCQRL